MAAEHPQWQVHFNNSFTQKFLSWVSLARLGSCAITLSLIVMEVDRAVESDIGPRHRTEHVGRGSFLNCIYKWKRRLFIPWWQGSKEDSFCQEALSELLMYSQEGVHVLMWDQLLPLLIRDLKEGRDPSMYLVMKVRSVWKTCRIELGWWELHQI